VFVVNQLRPRLAGIVATVLLTTFVVFWTYWSFGEFYYEGWGNPFPQPLAYLIPCSLSLLLAAAVLLWPRVMGVFVVLACVVFYGWAISMNLGRWGFSWSLVLSWGAMAIVSVLAGILFVVDGTQRLRRPIVQEPAPARPWWRRHLQPLVVFGVPLLIALAMSAIELPRVLGRLDDGQRGARVIEGNGVRLVWAPAGPGWNWRQPWGGYPSWDSLAFYGISPIGLKSSKSLGSRHATAADMSRTGLCEYLSADGTKLMAEPQHIWRMPTTNEYVRSLNRSGKAAGCTWSGLRGQAACATRPDKETPLWAPDEPPIYMWTGTERTPDTAWYVNYQGSVSAQPKNFGNPRHGYRCVKAPN
jgi:hypothetical protein